MFQAITSKAEPREGNERRAIGDGKDRARGMAIHHSAGPWSPPATTLKHSPIGLTCSQKACHAQVGVRGNQTEEWRNEKGGERYNKRASLVDFMSLKPGVTASSTPATVREKNMFMGYGVLTDGRGESKWQNIKKRTRKPH